LVLESLFDVLHWRL